MLDLMMPVMSGEEFLQALQLANANLKGIPVVVASANGPLLEAKLPANEVLRKPIDNQYLYRIAEQYA